MPIFGDAIVKSILSSALPDITVYTVLPPSPEDEYVYAKVVGGYENDPRWPLVRASVQIFSRATDYARAFELSELVHTALMDAEDRNLGTPYGRLANVHLFETPQLHQMPAAPANEWMFLGFYRLVMTDDEERAGHAPLPTAPSPVPTPPRVH